MKKTLFFDVETTGLDVMQIVHYMDYRNKINLENYKLATICNHFGIDIKAHDSMQDIRATRLLLNKTLYSF